MLRAEAISRRLRRVPIVYNLARGTLIRTRGLLPPRSVPGVAGRIHRNDLMFYPAAPDGAEAYDRIGRSAVELCEAALAAAGRDWGQVHSALDFGCGHGRVARQLTAVLRPHGGQLSVCDLDKEAVAFCAAEFGAQPIRSSRDFSQIALGRHDLVWAGSVATHLPEASWLSWIAAIAASLNPGGVFVFTTHGPECIDMDFQVEWVEHRDELRNQLARTGYAYVGYSYLPGAEYGLSAQTAERTDADLAAVGMTRVLLRPAGWEYQDVHGFQLRP
jgi:SAM-dependent methyltransferase